MGCAASLAKAVERELNEGNNNNSGDQSHLPFHEQEARDMPKWQKATLPSGVKFNRAEEVDDEDRLWLLHTATKEGYTLYAVNDGSINLHCTVLAKDQKGTLKPMSGSTEAPKYLLSRFSAGVVSPVLKPGDVVAVASLPGDDAGRASVLGKWRREQKPITGPGPQIPAGLTIEGTCYNQGLFLVGASNGCRYIYNDTDAPMSAKILIRDHKPKVPELVGPGLERNSNHGDFWDCGFVTPLLPPGHTIEAVQLTWPFYGQVLAKPSEPNEYGGGESAATGDARWTFPTERKSNVPLVVTADRSKWPKEMQGPGPVAFSAGGRSAAVAVTNGVSQQGDVTVRQEVGGKAWVVERKGYHPDFTGPQTPSGDRAPACSAAQMGAMTSLFVYNDTKDGEATFAFRFTKSNEPVAVARETAKGDGYGGKMTGRVRAGETKFIIAFDPSKCKYELEVECSGTPVAGTPMEEPKPKTFAPKINTSYLNNQGHVTRSS